jgi:TM2 domain-containing membrane protein YozV
LSFIVEKFPFQTILLEVSHVDNLMLKKDLSAEQLSMVDSEVQRRQKSKVIMYLLWWFTGGVGGHRYYLGDVGYAIAMTLTLGGLGIWSLIDVFFIGKRLELKTAQLELEIIKKVKVVSKPKVS